MNPVAAETEAFAAYLNAPRDRLDQEERDVLDRDTERARAAMERAWLEARPTRQ